MGHENIKNTTPVQHPVQRIDGTERQVTESQEVMFRSFSPMFHPSSSVNYPRTENQHENSILYVEFFFLLFLSSNSFFLFFFHVSSVVISYCEALLFDQKTGDPLLLISHKIMYVTCCTCD